MFNFDPGVGILAPCVDLRSAGVGSNDAVRTILGTSIAALYVAGLVRYLAFLENTNSPKALDDRISQLGTRGRMPKPNNGSRSLVAYKRMSWDGLSAMHLSSPERVVEKECDRYSIGRAHV